MSKLSHHASQAYLKAVADYLRVEVDHLDDDTIQTIACYYLDGLSAMSAAARISVQMKGD